MRSSMVDHYIFKFKEDKRLIFEILRDFIHHKIPDVEESFKWKCPFYSYKGLLCYLNWDNKAKKVALGFVEGCLMEDSYGVFSTDTKQVKKIFFSSVDELDERILDEYFVQAIEINERKKSNFMLNKNKKEILNK